MVMTPKGSALEYWTPVAAAALFVTSTILGCATTSNIGGPVRGAGAILPVSAQQAFDGYRSDPQYTHMKAFAVDMGTGTWGVAWGHGQSTWAVERALGECRKQGRSCELYAIGETVVLGMTREEIDAVLKRYPVSATALVDRAAAHARSARYDLAIADSTRALEMDPGLPTAYAARGAAYFDSRLYDAAIADLNRAIAIDPKLALAYSNRGLAYAEGKHRDEKAMADYDRAVAIDPTLAVAYYNRGNLHAKQGRHEQAIADYGRTVEIEPTFAEANHNRGNSYFAMGRYEEALSDYDHALRVNPKYAMAYSSRAEVYYLLKQYEKAWEDVRQAQGLGYEVPVELLQKLGEAAPFSAQQPEPSRRDAPNAIQSKALKHVRWSLDARVWRVLIDKVDPDADVEFAVTHEPSHGAIFVHVMELYEHTTDASFAATLEAVLDARKKDARSFKFLHPFEAIALPAHTSCKFSEERDDEDDPAKHYVRCVHVNDGWWSAITVTLPPGRWEPYARDLNTALERIRFPPKKHKSHLGFVATLPPGWLALSPAAAKAFADDLVTAARQLGHEGAAADQLRAKIETGAVEMLLREPLGEGGFTDNILVSRASGKVLPETPAGWPQLCKIHEALVAKDPRAYALRLLVCEERRPSGRPSLYIEISDRDPATVRMQYWIPRAKSDTLVVTATCNETRCAAVRSELDAIVRSVSFVD